MTVAIEGGEKEATMSDTIPSPRTRRRWPGVASLSPRNIGAIYVWAVLIVIFAIWIPDLFLTEITFRRVLNEYAITGIAALSIILPLAAGVFDLSVGATIGLSGIVTGWVLVHTSWPWGIAVLCGLGSGLAVGLFNALVVVVLRIDSFIGTLASGAIITAVTIGIAGDQILTGRTGGPFAQLATENWHGIQLPVIYMLALMLIIGFLLERTVFGRYAYASGYNPEVTTLVGVSVPRIRTVTLLSSGLMAAIAGVALTARVEAADPSNGPSYLIPAFSAAFLGATQFRRGRFNPWGAVVSVLLLGTGSVGLLLAGAPQWSPQVFQGGVLIAAVSLTVVQGRQRVAKKRAAA